MIWSGKSSPQESLARLHSKTKLTPLLAQRTKGKVTGELYLGDNREVCAGLLKKYRGRFDLIYLDPPYGVGGLFHAAEAGERSKVLRAYEDPKLRSQAFDVQGIFERLVLVRELLSERGSLYLQCDWRLSGLYRMLLDEVFGPDRFMNQVVWSYKTGGVPGKLGFAKKHDDIFIYARGKRPIFNPPTQRSFVPSLPEPHTPSGRRLGVKRDEICDRCGTGAPGQKYRLVKMRDVWDDIPALFRNDREIVGYDTQKPEKLLERIILTSSNPNSLVGDFFCGSGTTGAVAARLNRRWVLCDQSRVAIAVARRRLEKGDVTLYKG